MDDPAEKFTNGPFSGELLQRIAPQPYGPRHARLMPVAYVVAGVFVAFSALLVVADIVNPIKL